jgi:SAM-dependent methyltransferase
MTLFPVCNLCGWPLVRLDASVFGTRCVRCLSTQIHRAAGMVVDALALPRTSRVYELSSRGAMFAFLRRRFPDFYFSEYFSDVPPGGERKGVPCQDVQALRLPDASFDLVTHTEVFEHVPDDAKGFSEIFRVLKGGGRTVFTVPMVGEAVTVERAVLEAGGTIRHLLDPEYHSDRIRGKGTILAFRNYGADIVARLNAAGFEAKIERVDSERHRIFRRDVVVGRKPA